MSGWLKHHNTGRIDDSLFYSDNCNTAYAHTAWANQRLVAVLGPYDFIEVIEASDNETVAYLSVDLGSRC